MADPLPYAIIQMLFNILNNGRPGFDVKIIDVNVKYTLPINVNIC
ncbi:MAG: hypothetical protein WCD89_06185 [Anaerocolumna sp.]